MKERLRYLEKPIQKDALQANKMAFISGPRQVGKTTLALHLASRYPTQAYYNWDDVEFRRKWVKSPSSLLAQVSEGSCLVFDEIHKAKNWKRTLKGIYDLNQKKNKIIVTGSAQMDTFRRGGESLMGRYFHFRLHPYSLGELRKSANPTPKNFLSYLASPRAHSASESLEIQDSLLNLSGFPDPFEVGEKRHLLMWRQGRLEKVFVEDLRSLARSIEISQLELFASLLPARVGSLLSLQSLAEDMEVSQPTIKSWLGLLQNVFFHYTVRPFSTKMARAIKKESKIYLWDWTQTKNEGTRLENYVASHLFKAVDYWTQFGFGNYALHFYRDKEKREVDFVVTQDEQPWLLIEVKSSSKEPHPHLKYLGQKWPKAHRIQLIGDPNFYRYHPAEKIHVLSLVNFLEQLS